MFLGWYDPDKKYPTVQKVADAAERYFEKFGLCPEALLCHPSHALDLADSPYQCSFVNYIPINTFYIGMIEPEAAA